ncbi:hypothetical protein [Actinomyces gaoshouyii]|uniref:hypothetical protein n=1 Tax=Actinomyces gaoshouyii TaxID=1960083 RepID=UPI000F7A19DB|nr:hypothetical protein [Actinomyces gaoshouyii]
MEFNGAFGGLRRVDQHSEGLKALWLLQVIGFVAAGVMVLRFMIPELISPHAERFASSQYMGVVLFSAILAGAYMIIFLLPGDVMRRRIRGVRIAAVVQALWFGGSDRHAQRSLVKFCVPGSCGGGCHGQPAHATVHLNDWTR